MDSLATSSAASTIASAPGPWSWLEQALAWMTLLNAWEALGLLVIVSAFGFVLWKANRNRESPFSIADALEDPMTGKTSLQRVLVLGCFIGCWLVAFWRLLAHEDITNFVLIILGTFVGKSVIDRGAEVFDPRVKAQAYKLAPGSQPPTPAPVAPAAPADVTATLNVNQP